MAKRFKLRICRAIATTLQSCRSKDASDLPQDPVPSFSRLRQVNSKHPNRRHSPSAGGSSENMKASDKEITVARYPEQFKWEKEEKWHVVANVRQEPTPSRKMYNSSASCGDSEDDVTFANPAPLRQSAAEKKKRRAKKNKKNPPSRLRESTSSGDSGWFSCECAGGDDGGKREETEILVSSSLTLSTDSSSEFNCDPFQLNPIRKIQNLAINPPQYMRNKIRKLSKRRKRRDINHPAAEDELIPARLSMFMKLTPCIVDGKIKESFAVVKRSENPYEDFKNSMIDMIVEKQMFEDKDLEVLLQCFLSLNSRHYHGIIIQAFYEIWEAIFSAEGSKVFAGRRLRRV